MFYPVDSLKRGGRFYLCWVADSWPLRFAAITHRQLWSQDICILCDDLMEVIRNESGKPTSRFSLRLSSQLMRGLVRLYEKKVTVFLGDLCMLNANVLKHSNKKFLAVEVVARRSPPREPLPRPELAPEPNERVEEMIQNSGNVVVNIQDITLKEATIPEPQPNLNDNFGEEHPNQALQQLLFSQTVEQILQQNEEHGLPNIDQILPQNERVLPQTEQTLPQSRQVSPQNASNLLQDSQKVPQVEVPPLDVTMQPIEDIDRTVEQMLHQTEASAIQHSGLDLEVDKTDKSDKSRMSADKSRLVQDRQMERISEYDISMFRKSTAPPEPMEIDLEKDAPAIPEVPLLPIPALQVTAPSTPAIPQPEPAVPEPSVEAPQPAPPQQPVDIELEALEEEVGGRRRRVRQFPIVDKRTMLSGAYLRARIDNVHLEQRCVNSSDDIVDLRVPFDILSKRLAHSGSRIQPRGSKKLIIIVQRHLATEPRPVEEDEESEPEQLRARRRTRSQTQNVPKQPEPQPLVQELQIQPPAVETIDGNITKELNVSVPAPDLNITEQVPDLLNVTEIITNLEVTDPAAQPRPSDQANVQLTESPTKRPSIQPMDIQTEQIPDEQIPVEQVQPDIANQPDIAYLPTQVLERVEPQDIALLPTQVLERISQTKRSSQDDRPAKRPRPSGIQSFRETLLYDESAEKENIPPGEVRDRLSQPPPLPEPSLSRPKSVGAMLHEAGLSDLQQATRADEEQPTEFQVRAHIASADTDTPLGSLERTKVSLGDSVSTTDTQRFVRNQWGIEGTMVKILSMVRAGCSPVTVHTLVARGPTLPRAGGLIAARCFTSILKLKQHGFIKVTKDPETLDILNITLGPRFDDIQ